MKTHRLLFSLFGFCVLVVPRGEALERMDGIRIEAVESYATSKNFEVSFASAIYPLDPYHFDFSLEGGASYSFSKDLGWEFIHGAYAFAVQKDLVAQLAALTVGPTAIEKLEYLASTNLMFFPSYGKSVLFGSFVQQTRTCLLLGAGIVKTSLVSKPALSVGARFESYVGSNFSWRIEVRDHLVFEGAKHFISFGLGTGIYF